MSVQVEMSRKVFYIIIAFCATIIMMTSLEIIMKAKDIQLFEAWLSSPNIQLQMVGKTKEQMYSVYINMYLSTFFVRVITPMGLAIHSYITLSKLRVNKLYIRIWTVLLIGSILLSIIGESYYSIFFIISMISYIALIIIMIYLNKLLNDATRL